jgi:hypothetical protein
VHRRGALLDIMQIVPRIGELHARLDGVTTECLHSRNFIEFYYRSGRFFISIRRTSSSKTISRVRHAR